MSAPEQLYIPEGLVHGAKNWEVLSVFETPVSERISGMLVETDRNVALIMPSQPGAGELYVGFDIMLVKLDAEGHLPIKGVDMMRLTHNGTMGFVVAGTCWPSVDLDGQFTTWDADVNDGYGPRLQALKKLVVGHINDLIVPTPNQKVWENAALDIAPALARFFDLTPDEAPKQ